MRYTGRVKGARNLLQQCVLYDSVRLYVGFMALKGDGCAREINRGWEFAGSIYNRLYVFHDLGPITVAISGVRVQQAMGMGGSPPSPCFNLGTGPYNYKIWRAKLETKRIENIVVQSLMNAILRGMVASLYLFQGPRGTGKTSTARVLAAALNCLASNKTKPCGYCNENWSAVFFTFLSLCFLQHCGIKSQVKPGSLSE
ncbi:hypothetical protein RJ640_022311 [Escallonia rubra]|uniref:Uncharacterized protein n=1 Tax=Escallonia rubra TaxID=112253 RepID=A0AA88QSR8_9ASTE|nr:hypothetical protein RJ640_022311 [Escallonia rubra]